MKSLVSSRSRMVRRLVPLVCLIALATQIPTLTFAKNGRDFAGFYQLERVTQQGENYSLTLHLRIFNYSGLEVTNAKLVLHDSALLNKEYATFSGAAISNRGNAVLKSTQISISGHEFGWWQKHGPPLQIQFRTSEGKEITESVELIARPVGE